MATYFARETSVSLDDPGAMRRVGYAKVIGRVFRDGIAAINASGRFGLVGHAARLAGDLIAVIISLHWTWSEAHGRFLSFACPIFQVCRVLLAEAHEFSLSYNYTNAVLISS